MADLAGWASFNCPGPGPGWILCLAFGFLASFVWLIFRLEDKLVSLCVDTERTIEKLKIFFLESIPQSVVVLGTHWGLRIWFATNI